MKTKTGPDVSDEATRAHVRERYGNIAAGTTVGHLWVPVDGSQSEAMGITKYPEIPELRNWAPETPATLADVSGTTEKGLKEEAILEIVRENPLKYGCRALGVAVHDVYPDRFTSPKAATDMAGRMQKEGKLAKEPGNAGKYDLPGDPRVRVSESAAAIDPAVLEHEYEEGDGND